MKERERFSIFSNFTAEIREQISPKDDQSFL